VVFGRDLAEWPAYPCDRYAREVCYTFYFLIEPPKTHRAIFMPCSPNKKLSKKNPPR